MEDTKHEKSEEKEQNDDEDIAEEKEGIEMSDDFEGLVLYLHDSSLHSFVVCEAP